MFNGIRRSSERERQAYTQRHASGLDLGAVFQGFMEHWPHVERELPFYSEPKKPKARQEKQRELALQAQREDGKVEPKPVNSVKSKKPAVATPKSPEAAPSPVVEAVVKPFVAPPALPRLEKPGEAAIFPVPNHSAGQSGFSSTWSVAQKSSKEGVILSE